MHREKLQADDDAWDGPGLGARVEMRELAGRADQRSGLCHRDVAAGSAVGVCPGGLSRSGAFGEIALPRKCVGEVEFVAGPQDVAQKVSRIWPGALTGRSAGSAPS